MTYKLSLLVCDLMWCLICLWFHDIPCGCRPCASLAAPAWISSQLQRACDAENLCDLVWYCQILWDRRKNMQAPAKFLQHSRRRARSAHSSYLAGPGGPHSETSSTLPDDPRRPKRICGHDAHWGAQEAEFLANFLIFLLLIILVCPALLNGCWNQVAPCSHVMLISCYLMLMRRQPCRLRNM